MAEDYACKDCAINVADIGEYYMVHDTIWHRAGAGKDDMLCIGCLEQRLKRRLNPRDFNMVSCNIKSLFEGSPRIKHRMGASYIRQFLHNWQETGIWENNAMRQEREEAELQSLAALARLP